MAKLTAKQQRFVDEYLIDLNATQAAIRAGYSARNANNIASENLAKPNIKNRIEERMSEKEKELIANQAENAEQVGYKLVHKSSVSNSISQAMAHRSRRTGITQDRVLRELAKVAFVNANDVIDPDSATGKQEATPRSIKHTPKKKAC